MVIKNGHNINIQCVFNFFYIYLCLEVCVCVRMDTCLCTAVFSIMSALSKPISQQACSFTHPLRTGWHSLVSRRSTTKHFFFPLILLSPLKEALYSTVEISDYSKAGRCIRAEGCQALFAALRGNVR